MEEVSQCKWNFDFQNYKFLEGKYEWQEVEKGSLFEFYYRFLWLFKGVCKVLVQESQDVSVNCQVVFLIGFQVNLEDMYLVDLKIDMLDSFMGLVELCIGIRK